MKNLIDILEIVIKSCCSNLINLNDIDFFDDEIYHEILSALDSLNQSNIQEDELSKLISNLAKSDFKLQLQISNSLIDKFGQIENTEVSTSTRKGKAILVSGNNFENLYELLKETEGKNIDIYTHANLLIAHAFKKIQRF